MASWAWSSSLGGVWRPACIPRRARAALGRQERLVRAKARQQPGVLHDGPFGVGDQESVGAHSAWPLPCFSGREEGAPIARHKSGERSAPPFCAGSITASATCPGAAPATRAPAEWPDSAPPTELLAHSTFTPRPTALRDGRAGGAARALGRVALEQSLEALGHQPACLATQAMAAAQRPTWFDVTRSRYRGLEDEASGRRRRSKKSRPKSHGTPEALAQPQ